ncbi:MAG TPA: hypothetical protein PLX92_04880 [Anaerolineaceae bacterium]|nr:hypothetical protein [Anaerolineaceae bacterium]HUM49523.1 hypothetical protein [Anaerolineaceae bacterium]
MKPFINTSMYFPGESASIVGHKKRGDSTETRGKIANMLSIEERPAEVDELKVPCYLETYNSDNLGFYGSLGFKVMGSEKASLHAPSAWGLL